MRYKNFMLFLIAGLINIQFSQAQWHLENCPVKENLNSVFFTVLNEGWIVGNQGTILSFKGNKWTESKSPTKEHLYSVILIDKNNSWAFGAKGTIIHYNGSKWEQWKSPTCNSLYAVCFKDANYGIAVGAKGTIVNFKNGVWTLLNSKIRGDFHSVSYSNGYFWLGGGNECTNVPIMKISDETDLETKLYRNNYSSINSMVVLNDSAGWAVSDRKVILQFNGSNWTKYDINDEIPSLRSIFFIDENHGISCGYDGTILMYSDHQWIKQKSITPQLLNAALIRDNNCYVVGDSGTIITNKPINNNLMTNLLDEKQNGSNFSIFPNPCDSYMTISFFVENVNSTVSFTVSKINGQIIKVINQAWNAGYHYFNLSALDIESGTYIIYLTIDNTVEKTKFIVKH
jgi:photosystem II stability/assembly factor-like uncharacterized protein